MRVIALSVFVCFLAAVPAWADDPAPPAAQLVPGDQKAFDAGTKAFDEGRYEDAYRTFAALAKNEDLAAMRNVAFMKRKGLGTERDPDGALTILKYVARAGLPTAQYDCAEMLLDGEAAAPDAKAALPWLVLAADANHPLAQFRLGQLYENGTVVPQDYHKAEMLYAAAAEHGVRGAAERLAYLRGWPQPRFEGTPPVQGGVPRIPMPQQPAPAPPPGPENHSPAPTP